MMDPDYDLFMEIVSAGSLSGAGRSLNTSPAMVSKRLVRLEERLGARLIHRSTRKMALTGSGERLHHDLLAINAALQEAESRVQGEKEVPSGLLRVSAPTSFGRLHLAPHIGAFMEANPRVELALDLSDSFVDLFSGSLDVAIRIAADIPRSLVAHRLAQSERVLCAASGYIAANGEPASVADLADHRLLAAEGQLPWRLTGPDGPVSWDGIAHVRTNSSEVVRELAISGVGIALRSLWDVNHELASGALRRVLPAVTGSTDIAIYAVHPPMPRVPMAMAAFIEFLQRLYGPAPPWELGGG
ncbi:LysR family transcriptional regulator [Sphingobium sp. SCG-1]|uniref:LysR family transcriptional regulator n=1 Tax=Sphingobium sp. SCG-1 TaxID=2072936 RepID=UPI000CD6A43C|nr:LysR family transcriptional regulator [Sphingobium sp. SCG-1]AUW59833.1 LysR family transcriptional regulator [Sphingobium sp. SCG-1]